MGGPDCKLLWRNVHTQAGFLILVHISHTDDRVSHGKLETLAYVRVQAHDVLILDSLFFPHFIVETPNLRPLYVQGIASTQRTLSYYRMCEQFGFRSIVKFTLPLNFDLIACSCNLL